MSTKSTSETDEPGRIEQKIAERERPYRDAEILATLYHDRGLSTYEMAEELGCDQSTAWSNLRKNDILVRYQVETARESRRVERASYVIDSKGYERWRAREPDGSIVNVAVHQLLVIADGAEPAEVFSDGNNVHHRAGESAMNLGGGFVEVLSAAEHRRTHEANEWTVDEETGLPVLVTQDS